MAGAKVYAKGIVTFNPKETQPNFVLGTVVININQLSEWLKNEGAEYLSEYKGEKQIRLQLTSLKDKRGISLAVDTWKGNQTQGVKESTDKPITERSGVSSHGTTTRNGITTDDGDLPF